MLKNGGETAKYNGNVVYLFHKDKLCFSICVDHSCLGDKFHRRSERKLEFKREAKICYRSRGSQRVAGTRESALERVSRASSCIIDARLLSSNQQAEHNDIAIVVAYGRPGTRY